MKRSQLCGAWDTRSLDITTQEVSLCTMLPICWIFFLYHQQIKQHILDTLQAITLGLFAITGLEATMSPRFQF